MDLKFNKNVTVANYEISEHSPTFIIAEAGVNHNGKMNLAKRLIDVAVKARANAVKFQTFQAENLILKNVTKAPYQLKTTEAKESQFDMLKKLEINKEQNLELKAYCEKHQIIFLTTPFDEESLKELDELDLSAYKVASTDITNFPFLKKIAQKRKPVFLSTGMSYLSEIEMALREVYPYNKDIILMQCTANYPIEDEEVNLAVLETFQKHFDILAGFSDHSVGIGASPYAVPMGVKVIEKHFTLDKNMEGPDQKASLSPDELKVFVKQIRKVEEYMGSSIKTPTLSEIDTRASLQKCLVAKKNIKKGEIFTEKNIVAKRTGGVGISPIFFATIKYRKAKRNFKKDEPIIL